ncbi:MAG: proton-conducting transporter membrane subunit, partial [Planctomycetota bacterium]|nr:proton-conducting transporter membrane subunit [Planctomycetota bacterium]
VNQICTWTFAVSTFACLVLDIGLLFQFFAVKTISIASFIALRSYYLNLEVIMDFQGLGFLTLDFMLCGLIGAFSTTYLHRDEGYNRFYLLLIIFNLGIAAIALANGLDLILAGWELVGLSSALLIAFFHQRMGPVDNGLRTYGIYRLTDVGLLFSVIIMHHFREDMTFNNLSTTILTVSDNHILIIGLALIIGAMGKGAIFPLTGWLPRGMEGPTPSSAIFYGALSTHASPFLLLRVYPILEHSLMLRVIVIGLGVITALHSTSVGRTQNDVKSDIAYSTSTQIALMWIEIGLGFTNLALLHFVSHSILRTWQTLRAPSVLSDRRAVMLSKGDAIEQTGAQYKILPQTLRQGLYTWALERWYLDDMALAFVIGPIRSVLLFINDLDQSFGKYLNGDDSLEEESPE